MKSNIIELPGLIDAHVHFREPGLTYKEDFKTGSTAAAMGGITFFCDMPNTLPPTSTLENFLEKKRTAEEKSIVNFGLFALLTHDNTRDIPKLSDAGTVGFKVFLGTSTGNIASPPDNVLEEQLLLCTKLGKRVGFHAETSEINEQCTAECKQKYPAPNGMQLSEARPVQSEVLAVEKAIALARKTKAMIHIHHVTSKQSAELIANAKKDGLDVTCETCPHYLFLNSEDYTHKVYPPIRSEEHRLALWDAIKDGTIDMIATDHAPHAADEKNLPLWESPAGLTGVETFASLMLNEVIKGTITLDDFVRLASIQPAKIWGINNEGSFTIVDMDKKIKIDKDKLQSKSKTTPFDGWELRGAVVKTIVRGKTISI